MVSISWNCRAFCWILEHREVAESLSAVGTVSREGPLVWGIRCAEVEEQH